MGGGCMQEFNLEIYGVDVFANFFLSTFGIPINPPTLPAQCAMADYSITCEKTGIISSLEPFNLIREHPNVVRSTPFVEEGSKVVGYDTGFPVWLGEFVVKAETSKRCKDIIE